MKSACLWLRVSTEGKGQDPALQQADLVKLCQQRDWEVVQTYKVEESAFGKKPRPQFQAMLEEARKGRFNIIVVWSMDRFSREGEWSVFSVISWLQNWNVQFYSFSEPMLDTTGPYAGFMIPLFAWLARQEGVRHSKAVKLGMEKAKAQGKNIGRPMVQSKVKIDLVMRLRDEGLSWAQIRRRHPLVRSEGGRRLRPSVTTIRKALLNQKALTKG